MEIRVELPIPPIVFPGGVDIALRRVFLVAKSVKAMERLRPEGVSKGVGFLLWKSFVICHGSLLDFEAYEEHLWINLFPYGLKLFYFYQHSNEEGQ